MIIVFKVNYLSVSLSVRQRQESWVSDRGGAVKDQSLLDVVTSPTLLLLSEDAEPRFSPEHGNAHHFIHIHNRHCFLKLALSTGAMLTPGKGLNQTATELKCIYNTIVYSGIKISPRWNKGVLTDQSTGTGLSKYMHDIQISRRSYRCSGHSQRAALHSL